MSTNKPADLFTLEALATRLGERHGDVSSVNLPKMKQFINIALIEMNDFGNWRQWNIPNEYNFVTESGVSKYAICESVKSITAMYTKNPDRSLFKINDQQYRRYVPDETDITGEPTHYYEAGYDGSSKSINVILHPVPNQVLTVYVDGDIQVPLLTNDKEDVRQKCYLPQNLIPTLLDVAFNLAAIDLDPQNFAAAEARKEKALERAYMNDQNQPDERIIARDHYGGASESSLDPNLPPNLG